MANEKISQYVEDATSKPINQGDLMDFSNNNSLGGVPPYAYDVSKKITVGELITYLFNVFGFSIYTGDGSLFENRTVTSQTFFTKFLGGDVICEVDNESDDYAFLVHAIGAVEAARFGYDQNTQSAIFELSNLTNKFIEFNDNKVNLNVDGLATWSVSQPQLSTANAGFIGQVKTDRVAYFNNIGYSQSSFVGVFEVLVGLGITTLTADRTQTYQDKDGIIALTSDIPQGLAETISINNTILDSQQIESVDGKAFLQINNLGVGAFKGTIAVDHVSVLDISDGQAQFFLLSPTFSRTGGFGIFQNDVLRNFNAGAGDSYPSRISAKGGILNQDVKNSVQIGGNSTIVKTDETAYCNQLAFNTGEAFETVIDYTTPTADRTITLPDADINFETAITEVLNFATDAAGQVSTMTFANGVLVSRTLSV